MVFMMLVVAVVVTGAGCGAGDVCRRSGAAGYGVVALVMVVCKSW